MKVHSDRDTPLIKNLSSASPLFTELSLKVKFYDLTFESLNRTAYPVSQFSHYSPSRTLLFLQTELCFLMHTM